MCARTKCENKAEYYPKILMYAHTGSGAAEAVLKLPLCGQCIIQTLPSDLLNEEWWTLMNKTFDGVGKKRPKRRLTRVVPMRIEEWDKISGKGGEHA